LLGAQVIETGKTDGFAWNPGIAGIAVNHIKTGLVKFVCNVATRFYCMVMFAFDEMFKEFHERGFPAAYRTGQQYTLVQVNAFMASSFLVI